MNADDRLDQQIRAALEWQAGQAVRRAPSVARSTSVVASRLGRESSGIVPVISARPRASRSFQLAVLGLLLLVLLAAAFAIGSRLLRPQVPPIDPGPFGFASSCNPQLPVGAVLEFNRAEVQTRLYEDGTLATDLSSRDSSRSSIVTGATFGERHLSQRGIDLLVDRIGQTGLTAGCRRVETLATSGHLVVGVGDGVARLTWGPPSAPVPSPQLVPSEREQRILALAEVIEGLELWLPADGWEDDRERRVEPDRWILTIGIQPTDYLPGDRLELPEGPSIDGSDPRYRQITLPGGQAPVEFGKPLPFPGRFAAGSTERCGMLDGPEALALANSLDALQLGADGYGDMFTDDLSSAIAFDLTPGYPAGYDCGALAAEWLEQQQPPTVTAVPAGDHAGIDPCSLLSQEIELLLESTDRTRSRSALPLGLEAWSCVLSRFEHDVESRLATITLYPWSIEIDDAETLATELLGGQTQVRRIDEDAVWTTECADWESHQCRRIVAAWSGGFFVVVNVEIFYMDPGRNVPLDDLVGVAQAVLRAVET
jgi:hypothetical protein